MDSEVLSVKTTVPPSLPAYKGQIVSLFCQWTCYTLRTWDSPVSLAYVIAAEVVSHVMAILNIKIRQTNFCLNIQMLLLWLVLKENARELGSLHE